MAKPTQLEELRQTLDGDPDRDRVSLLLQLAEATKTDNPKHSRQLLDEAFGLVTRPATSYKQFEDQLRSRMSWARSSHSGVLTYWSRA